MIQARPYTIEKQWELFLDTYAPDALFQRWQWGEVCTRQHEQVYRIGLYEKDTCIGVAQCIVVKAKRGNFLHVRHGPVLSRWDKRVFSQVRNIIRALAKEHGCVCVRISPRIEGSDPVKKMFRNAGGIPAAIHAMDAECAWVLDITPSEDTLLSGMRKTTRYEIRRAIKVGVGITISKEKKDLSYFTELYKETAKRHGFVKHTGIESEFDVFTKKDQAVIITGFFEKKPIASALILFSGHQAIYHHGASIASSIPVSYLVQWEAIRYAKERGVKEYNFWGIAPDGDPSHPWFGLSAFKKGFGGKEARTIHAYDFPVSFRYWILYVIEWVRKQLKGYS